MYLEHEELLKLTYTLEHERDQARGEACLLAARLRGVRQSLLREQVESDLLVHAIAYDPTIHYCDDILERYTS